MFTWIWQAENSWLFPNEWNTRPYVSTFKQFWTRGIILSALCWNCTLNTQRIQAIQEIWHPPPSFFSTFPLATKPLHTTYITHSHHKFAGALVSWWRLCFRGSCILNRERQLSRLFPSNSVWERNVSEPLWGHIDNMDTYFSSQKHGPNRCIKEEALIFAFRMTRRFVSPLSVLEHPHVKLG